MKIRNFGLDNVVRAFLWVFLMGLGIKLFNDGNGILIKVLSLISTSLVMGGLLSPEGSLKAKRICMILGLSGIVISVILNSSYYP